MANASIKAAFERMWEHVINVLGSKSDVDHGHTTATFTSDGFMAKDDKRKLSGIEENANNYTLPAAGSKLGGVKTGGDATITEGVIKLNYDSLFALEVLMETGSVVPVSNNNNALYTNNDGAIYVL